MDRSSTACLDWRERIREGRSIIPEPLFPEEADACVEVMKALRIVDAPGSPTIGEACAPWVFDLARSIFGAYDAESGRRLITEWFVLIPKKNAKSTMAAAIMLTALIRNWRQSAEFIVLAPTVEIAGNCYAPARDMVRKDDDLDTLMLVQTHVKTITHNTTGATLKVVAADSNTVGGKKAVGILIDEAWLFGKMPDAENMLREATGGLASRPEGFIIWLTTQSDDPPAGIFRQKLQYARDVRDGKVVDPRFVPVLYEFPEDMIEAKEYLEPKNFGLVNPNLGFSVDPEFLEREFGKAQNAGDESMRGFLAKHLNVEIGLALRSNNWAGALFWESCKSELTLDSLLERSEVVTIGVDGGGLDDLLGMCVLGRDKVTGDWLHWAHAWAHPIVLERRKQEAPRLLDFQARGELTIVQDIGDDVDGVADIVERCEEARLLERVGVDAAGIGSIVDALIDRGIAQDRIVAIPQGWKMVGAIKTLERKVAEGTIEHGGSTLMNWCVGNARVEPRGNAVIITKQAAGSAKIDPLLATFNAVTLMSLNPAPRNKKLVMFTVG